MNEKNQLVSLIVPVYNARDYLDTCVDSLLHQTHADIQVILVDDGSTDGSADLCDAWADKDARVMVIHRANSGVSAARNAGLDAAIGWNSWMPMIGLKRKPSRNCLSWSMTGMRRWPYSITEVCRLTPPQAPCTLRNLITGFLPASFPARTHWIASSPIPE